MVVEFIQNLLELVQQIRPGHQTLTHYGFSGDELTAFAHNCVLSGLSRIVPIGQALNFDAVWDGYDLLRELTRTIRLGLEVRFALMSVKENAYHLLRRLTPQRQRERVKARISQARRAAAPILKKWYGTFGDDDLERALREKMPGGFEILMVHSSITHLQPMYDGDARSLLELMFRIAGPEATLAMPAFFFGTAELFSRAYYRKHPKFDVRRTLSQMGLALLWQIYSRRRLLQIHFRQCGHRCGGSRAKSSRMAWRTAGKVG